MTLSVYEELIERIYDELDDLNRTVGRAANAWQKAPTSIDQDVYVDSAALHLQSFYTGLERICWQIAGQIDNKPPTGDSWHVELLRQMGKDVPGVRPAVLSQESITGLDEFRRFRHVVRNIYATNLDPQRMQDLFRILTVVWPQVRAELLAFADFLRLVEEDSHPPQTDR